jgi:hypothetical protein
MGNLLFSWAPRKRIVDGAATDNERFLIEPDLSHQSQPKRRANLRSMGQADISAILR